MTLAALSLLSLDKPMLLDRSYSTRLPGLGMSSGRKLMRDCGCGLVEFQTLKMVPKSSNSLCPARNGSHVYTKICYTLRRAALHMNTRQ